MTERAEMHFRFFCYRTPNKDSPASENMVSGRVRAFLHRVTATIPGTDALWRSPVAWDANARAHPTRPASRS